MLVGCDGEDAPGGPGGHLSQGPALRLEFLYGYWPPCLLATPSSVGILLASLNVELVKFPTQGFVSTVLLDTGLAGFPEVPWQGGQGLGPRLGQDFTCGL